MTRRFDFGNIFNEVIRVIDCFPQPCYNLAEMVRVSPEWLDG